MIEAIHFKPLSRKNNNIALPNKKDNKIKYSVAQSGYTKIK